MAKMYSTRQVAKRKMTDREYDKGVSEVQGITYISTKTE